jgi:hypothetical protein
MRALRGSLRTVGVRGARSYFPLVALGVLWGCSSESTGNGTMSDAHVADAASGAPGPDDASGHCTINVANYDRTCDADSDCVGVAFANDGEANGIPIQSGNFCSNMCVCGGEALSRRGAAQYANDVLMTPLYSGALADASGCFCPVEALPCCQESSCTTGCGDARPALDGSGADR